jgi:hypothetical protein
MEHVIRCSGRPGLKVSCGGSPRPRDLPGTRLPLIRSGSHGSNRITASRHTALGSSRPDLCCMPISCSSAIAKSPTRCGCLAAKIEPVPDIGGLKKYLAKERTPQAGHRRRDLGGRIRGSHLLPGGGDRVRLSRQLERDAIEAGLVDPWKHTNAKRSAQRKDYRPRRSSHDVERHSLELQNLIEAPVHPSDRQKTMDRSPELTASIGAAIEKTP